MRPLDRAFAGVYDRIMAPVEARTLGELRSQLLAGMSGAVVDVGAGTGANLAHLPDAVRSVTLAEPSPEMAAKLRDRVHTHLGDAAARGVDRDVTVFEAPAEELPLPDASVDHAIVTLVLCTVDDPTRAIAELRRVLKPGGTVAVLEHVHADGWSGRVASVIEPVWTVAARGCKLTRDTRQALADGGFDVSAITGTTWPGPRFATTGIAGLARPLPSAPSTS